MLDGKELARRVRTAISLAGISQAKIARACQVTPQALTGWLKTGRIAKRHLETIAAITKKDLEFFLSEKPGNMARLLLSPEEAAAVREFLAVNGAWRGLWLEVVKKNDSRLRRVVELYAGADEQGRQMIYTGARGAQLLREHDGSSTEASRRARKRG